MGVVGIDLTAKFLAALYPQDVPAFTEIVPEIKFAGNVKLIEVVPCPLLMIIPTGTVYK